MEGGEGGRGVDRGNIRVPLRGQGSQTNVQMVLIDSLRECQGGSEEQSEGGREGRREGGRPARTDLP